MLGQLKVHPSSEFIKIGSISNPPLQLLHIEDIAMDTPGFLLEATQNNSTVNFVKTVAGTQGSGFYFKNNNWFAISPVTSIQDVSPDWNNLVIIYGPNHALYPGRVGVGKRYPSTRLHVNGDITSDGCINTNGSNCTSDLRLKKDVELYKKGLKEVLELSPIQFQYNGLGNTKDNSQHIGLIAQEVQKVAPELVQSGNASDEHDDPYLQIRESEIKYLIINAVKQQQQMIQQLEQKVESLTKNKMELDKELKKIQDQVNELKLIKQ